MRLLLLAVLAAAFLLNPGSVLMGFPGIVLLALCAVGSFLVARRAELAYSLTALSLLNLLSLAFLLAAHP